MHNLTISLHTSIGPTWSSLSRSAINSIHHDRQSISSALPPSPPPTIPPLNNSINEVSLHDTISKYGQEWTDFAWQLNIDDRLATSGQLLSPYYQTIPTLLPVAHLHSHASNANSTPERTTTFEEKLIDTPNRCYNMNSNKTQPSSLETMETDENPPRTPSPCMTQLSLTKTWCGKIHLIVILLQEAATFFFYQSPLVPHQQNQPNRISHLAMLYPLRLYTSHPYMIIYQRQRKRHPLPIPILTQNPKNINYIHISDIISGKSPFPGLNTTNKQTLHGSKFLSMEEGIVASTIAILKWPVPEATPTHLK